MEIIEGPAAGKTIIDRISLPHPMESQWKVQRRVRIAYRLGLIERGTKETVNLNFKALEGKICWIDLILKEFQGRRILIVANYSRLTAR